MQREEHPSHVDGTREDSSQADASAPAFTAQLVAEAGRRAVKHRLKSVVQEICTLRSVGAGGR